MWLEKRKISMFFWGYITVMYTTWPCLRPKPLRSGRIFSVPCGVGNRRACGIYCRLSRKCSGRRITMLRVCWPLLRKNVWLVNKYVKFCLKKGRFSRFFMFFFRSTFTLKRKIVLIFYQGENLFEVPAVFGTFFWAEHSLLVSSWPILWSCLRRTKKSLLEDHFNNWTRDNIS